MSHFGQFRGAESECRSARLSPGVVATNVKPAIDDPRASKGRRKVEE
jgi:hypothetical protein